jgi:hypothetical protein
MDDKNTTEETKTPGVGENVAPTTVESTTQKHVLTDEQKEKLEQQRKFFYNLRKGANFLKFIYNDIERQKKDHLNRAQRRRFEKELRKGNFSKELIEIYSARIEEIEKYIEEQMNPKPVEKVAEVDGAQFYADLKAKEAKGELKEPETK